ncbi:hypothetical protein [Tritonibacter mobilis]|uniref:hypothetical protein n=1 Tax=Tritonibacter mobilis TaxID=379347 RepID=UPI000B575F90|nr:hypothetical protein [Tritonibacter mobilis]ANH49102.1 hypothetical protein [Ruegeria phage 45A6]
MVDKREIVQSTAGGDDIAPHEDMREGDVFDPQSDSEAENQGPDTNWKFWDEQIKAALIHERRWRHEALDCERLYFGDDNDPGAGGADDGKRENRISDKTALIHSNIDVLKPLLFSETPQPVVRRRFRGDGRVDETDLMAAEAGQRIAQFLIETEPFDDVMECVRDDWLITDRGAGRVYYKADIANISITDPMSGEEVQVPVKTRERVCPRYVEWRRLVFAPSHSWENMPWLAFETPMTRSMIEKRFGLEVAERVNFNQKGLVGSSQAMREDDRDPDNHLIEDSETGEKAISPFDTAMVWEIWNRDSEEVIWWSASYTDGVLDKEADPLGLEDFYPMPKPLLGTTKGEQLTPRPSIKYYERRAREIDLASEKLHTILDVVSVSGLFPGQMQDEVKKLLDGNNTMIPVESWIKLMEKGGTNNIIQWLPLQHMIAAIQALITLREQAKQAMFEASGVSDIMRAQGNPNETATAQQIKGRYAGLRLSDRQRKMAIYARDMLRLMVEIAVEHFDTDYIADMTGLDLPMTEMDREAMIAQQQAMQAEFQRLSQLHQMMGQAVQAGQMAGPLPPPPEPPEEVKIPGTSWEKVHERLRSDYGRKISVTIETQSTVLADEQADKEARIEFLSAFSKFVSELAPLAGSGQFDYKTVKELLLFGVRGFPKSRTLEGLIASLPDEPKGEAPENPSITVAKIKAQVDAEIEKMRMADKEKERQHERQMKGVDVMTDAVKTAGDAGKPQPAPPL